LNDSSQDSTSHDASALLAEERTGDNAEALSVSALSSALKRTVEDRFGYVRVRGELTGCKRAASGHFYFGLKDDGAKLDGVMWKGTAGRLAFAPEDGLEVVVTGMLTTYGQRSSYQIIADKMELAGEGALMLLFEKLKNRLAAEGLFDQERKQAIPRLPRTIGVVTSPTGAVIRDILHRLADRFPSHVLVWPVMVQGDGAAKQIAAAIRGFSQMPADGPVTRPDLVIVARGGGSIEDLWAFNEEEVVRAVAECTIPLISAVGHETDTTLCDFAADLRAPTPTAAAELAVPVRADLRDRLDENGLRLSRAAKRIWALCAERFVTQNRLMPRLSDLAAPYQQRADELGERLARGLGRRVDIARLGLAGSASRLNPQLLMRLHISQQQSLNRLRMPTSLLQQKLGDSQRRLDGLSRLVESLHPEAPLKRGFARVTDHAGLTVMSAAAAKAAGQVGLRFADGGVSANILSAGQAKSPAAPKPARQSGGGSSQQSDLFNE
jgi:exodeoxyribonuclease VII large subunit